MEGGDIQMSLRWGKPRKKEKRRNKGTPGAIPLDAEIARLAKQAAKAAAKEKKGEKR